MYGRSLALRGGGRVQFAPDLGAFLVDLVHGFVDVPIVLQRVRHQFGEPPWPAGQEILGGGPFRHHRDVRQAFRTVLQCDGMAGLQGFEYGVPIGMEEAPGSTSSPCSQP